jgi:glycosyltransferase involved in cell wall biosynthesis
VKERYNQVHFLQAIIGGGLSLKIKNAELSKAKTALVHDWLTGMRGGERVLESIYELFPAPVYTLIQTKNFKSKIIDIKNVATSSLQRIPFIGRFYRKLPALFPKAIEEFDLSSYDLVLSTSHAVAKGVLTNSNQLHICYMHTPIRYAWDLTFQYLREAGLDKGVFSHYARNVLHKIRLWDVISASRVDHFVTNSHYVARRIKKIYGRESTVIYPPVDVDYFDLYEKKEDFYLAASQMVPYKKMDLIVKAFLSLPDKKLVVIGKGPQFNRVKKIAGKAKNIEILGYQPDSVLKTCLQRAKAFIFAAEEDFGILPVEAQACGTPVIAYGKGGALETVVDNETGIFFGRQEEGSLIEAIRRFEEKQKQFDCKKIRGHAENFSKDIFQKKYRKFVEDKYSEFVKKNKRIV